jgi:hypothetical protein
MFGAFDFRYADAGDKSNCQCWGRIVNQSGVQQGTNAYVKLRAITVERRTINAFHIGYLTAGTVLYLQAAAQTDAGGSFLENDAGILYSYATRLQHVQIG